MKLETSCQHPASEEHDSKGPHLASSPAAAAASDSFGFPTRIYVVVVLLRVHRQVGLQKCGGRDTRQRARGELPIDPAQSGDHANICLAVPVLRSGWTSVFRRNLRGSAVAMAQLVHPVQPDANLGRWRKG